MGNIDTCLHWLLTFPSGRQSPSSNYNYKPKCGNLHQLLSYHIWYPPFSGELELECKIEYASCIVSHIYLGMTKAGKVLSSSWENPFEIVITCLRQQLLCGGQILKVTFQLYLRTNFFWSHGINTGWSTGCFIITYQGGIADHSSNLPDPVALFLLEAEYD